MIPFILKANSLSLFPPNGAAITIDSTHMNFTDVVAAIKSGDYDTAVELASVPTYINRISSGRITIDDNHVNYNGTPITGYLASKMHRMFQEGVPVQHYCAFLDNLMSNPSMVSRNELYLFLEAADLPITEDGCFLAYKAVRHDFKDKHTGSFDNSPGQVLTMPRRAVNDDRNQTCSHGYHAAAFSYAKNFLAGSGDRLMVVKINPADVVSIPADYNNTKLRTCSYTVMWEVEGALDELKNKSFVNTTTNSDDNDIYPDDDNNYDDDYDNYDPTINDDEPEDVAPGKLAGYDAYGRPYYYR